MAYVGEVRVRSSSVETAAKKQAQKDKVAAERMSAGGEVQPSGGIDNQWLVLGGIGGLALVALLLNKRGAK